MKKSNWLFLIPLISICEITTATDGVLVLNHSFKGLPKCAEGIYRPGNYQPISPNGDPIRRFGNIIANPSYEHPSKTIINNPIATNWRLCNLTGGWEANLASNEFNIEKIYVPNESCMDIGLKIVSAQYDCPSKFYPQGDCNQRFYRFSSQGTIDRNNNICTTGPTPQKIIYFNLNGKMLSALTNKPGEGKPWSWIRIPKGHTGNIYIVIRNQLSTYKICAPETTLKASSALNTSTPDITVHLSKPSPCTIVEGRQIWISESRQDVETLGGYAEIQP